MENLDVVLSADYVLYSEEFLAQLCADYDAATADGETADVQALLARAGERDVVTAEFLQAALEMVGDPALVFAELREIGPDVAAARHRELVDARQSAGDPASGGEDEASWARYLAENAPAWDGVEDSWQGFTEWFIYYAEEAGVAGSAKEFCDYVGASDDKIAVLAAYGVTIAPAAPQGVDGPPGSGGPGGEDVGTWTEFLGSNGPRWDGANGSWAEFGEWFAYYADQAGVPQSAVAFLNYVDSAPDRRGAFAEYGIEIAARPEARGGFAEDADGRDDPHLIEEVVSDIADEVIADFRDQHPQFAELGDNELRTMIADVVREAAAAAVS